jgi:hypothetical protein
MDYYLYSHSNANGIFYIGKGCGDRSKVKRLAQRSAEWHEASKNGYTTKTEANGTNADILILEKIMIKSLIEQGVNLVNKIHNKHWTRSAENRKKVAVARLGKHLSDKSKKKISDANTGNKHTDKAKEKISQAMSGKNHPNYGKKMNPETRKKLSAVNTGNKYSVGVKRPDLLYYNKKRGQHNKLAKANAYTRGEV